MRWRRHRPAVEVAPGEKVLAWAETDRGVAAGTRDAFYVDGARLPWEQVQGVDWDRDASILRISEVGTWGVARPEHELVVGEPGLLLELVRERVTASVLLQRHVPVAGHRGVRVIARRAPGRPEHVTWLYEYDEGVDPDDPVVRTAADAALEAARAEVGHR